MLIYIPLCIYFNFSSYDRNSNVVFIYIPLCIYFNIQLCLVCLRFLNHLHSTMYLFQLLGFNRFGFRYVHLHSTMYLFQQVLPRLHRLSSCSFTFHYVSISTRCSTDATFRLVIYIPLCIYFNLQAAVGLFLGILDLHSTMYLFQLAFQPTVLLCSRFTFHYVSISTRPEQADYTFKEIYIPLCIYFNKLQLRLGDDFRNLHSTMYLFQPTITVYGYSFTIIYIPLCIYFNYFPLLLPHCCCQIYIPLCIYFNDL